MDISAVIAELAIHTGLDALTLDAERRCSVCFDHEHTVTFEHNPDDGALLIYAAVASVANLRSAESARTLLEASLLGAQTGGAAFGLHAPTGDVYLWKRLDENFASYGAFEQKLNDFLAQVIAWKQRAPKLAEAAPDRTGNDVAPAFLLTGLRV